MALMQAFEQQLREAGYLAMSGQIVDATLVSAPKQRNTQDQKAAIKAGKSARQIWRGKPNQAHQKGVDARWTVKIGGKIRYRRSPRSCLATSGISASIGGSGSSERLRSPRQPIATVAS